MLILGVSHSNWTVDSDEQGDGKQNLQCILAVHTKTFPGRRDKINRENDKEHICTSV